MPETWRPFVALIENLGELLALARDATTVGSSGGSGVDSGPVGVAVERFRDALVEAFEVELLPVRLYHRRRVGFITRVIPRPHATQAPSYSDEARDLAEEQLARMVDGAGEYYLGDPEQLEPKAVTLHWADMASDLLFLDIPEGSLSRLMELVQEEHRAAPAARPVLPLVYRAPNEASSSRLRHETRARRAGYEIDAAFGDPKGHAARSPTDQIFFIAAEPADRSVTKVAGLPYRAAGLPWPRTDDGRPMTFLAQFCFAESRDLVGKLPGDLLLIFAEGRDAYLPDPYDSSLRFEWHPLGVRDLVGAEAIPELAWKLRP
jgi:hypothetical protein